ncbi:hypothetical protein [Klebsiella pneumoniae IS46]|nr:hypothetical protein [Klebsiella pneumoniae IS46]CDL14383.1 hypothetical protein [Klebsiella pneumoniae IS46]
MGYISPGGAALTGATKPYPGQSAQHRLRENPSYITVDK